MDSGACLVPQVRVRSLDANLGGGRLARSGVINLDSILTIPISREWFATFFSQPVTGEPVALFQVQ